MNGTNPLRLKEVLEVPKYPYATNRIDLRY